MLKGRLIASRLVCTPPPWLALADLLLWCWPLPMLALADASRSSKKQLLLCRKESCLVMVLSLLLHLVRYELDDRLLVGTWW
jgi:hypothetical protein